MAPVAGLTASTITNSKVVQLGSTKTHYSDATLANLRAIRAIPDEAAIRTGAYYMHATFEQMLAGFNTAGDRPYNPNSQLMALARSHSWSARRSMVSRFADTDHAGVFASANASKVFILFGDISYQYLGIRGGIRFDTSVDAAFATDEILIRCLERFTIGMMAPGAVAGLETAAS